MKLLKFILPITAMLMVFAVVESTAQICVYDKNTKYSLEDVVANKCNLSDDMNLKFLKFCCDNLGICTPGYLSDGHYYLTHIASKYNRARTLEYLIEEKRIPSDQFPFVRIGDTFEKKTPTMMGAENGSLEAVQYLVEKAGVMVTRQNPDGHDTLYYAKKSGSKKMIDYVQSKWTKEKGFSEMLIEQEKAKLRNLLKPEAIQKHFAQNTAANSVVQTTKPFIQSAVQAQDFKQI